MAKRRTSGIQRRARASEEALTRRVGEGGMALDWRLLAIGGVLVLGAVLVLVVLLFGGSNGGSTGVGQRQVDDGRGHITEGQSGGPYSSVPATSGQHWPTPANWGIYTGALPEEMVLHNLEHGGIVVWYQPDQLDEAQLTTLRDWVQAQVQSERYKVILTPWNGTDFGHAVAATSWNWLLYQDAPDVDQLRAFLDDHYGDAPEPFGGPGRPGG